MVNRICRNVRGSISRQKKRNKNDENSGQQGGLTLRSKYLFRAITPTIAVDWLPRNYCSLGGSQANRQSHAHHSKKILDRLPLSNRFYSPSPLNSAVSSGYWIDTIRLPSETGNNLNSYCNYRLSIIVRTRLSKKTLKMCCGCSLLVSPVIMQRLPLGEI